jgi:hypothetical protein
MTLLLHIPASHRQVASSDKRVWMAFADLAPMTRQVAGADGITGGPIAHAGRRAR